MTYITLEKAVRVACSTFSCISILALSHRNENNILISSYESRFNFCDGSSASIITNEPPTTT